MANFLNLKPVIWTKQLDETIAFYTDILGFECAAYDDEWGWASLSRDGVVVMMAYPNAHIPFEGPVFTGSLYISTDDVDKLWEQWKDKCRICYGVETFEYGMREFAIYDNNGYLLQFGQQI